MAASRGPKLLQALRSKLKASNLNAWLLLHSDSHMSEYLAACDERCAFLSGFTGTNATGLVTMDPSAQEDDMSNSAQFALMWTDGRYYLQAQKQLMDGWQMMKIEPGHQNYVEWIKSTLPEGSKIGCDEAQIPWRTYQRGSEAFKKKGIELVPGKSLVDELWEDRPSISESAVWVLDDQYAGETVQSKYDRIAEKMGESELLVLSTLDDIAWLTNMRGTDINFNPLFFSYVIFHNNKKANQPNSVDLFISSSKVNDPSVSKHLTDNNITVHPYDALDAKIREYGQTYQGIKKVVIDEGSVTFKVVKLLKEQGFDIDHKSDMIGIMKSAKNTKQMDGMRKCNVRDCAAIMKYFAFLDEELQKPDHSLDEYVGAKKLLEFREMGDIFRGPSFKTISSIGANGAVIHYKPLVDECSKLNTDEIYLLDSGGQYLDGTTDITRTTHFGGNPTPFQKEAYTRVLLGNLDVERVVWPKNSKFTGADFDILARRHLFEVGLDYKHGTGHGVGSMLCVHECASVGISRAKSTELIQGMCVSNEPGYYQDGEFGIRIENVLMVVEHPQYNNRLMFENLTVAPYARELLDLDLISKEDLDYINRYHERCLKEVSPLLQEDSRALKYFERACAPIVKETKKGEQTL